MDDEVRFLQTLAERLPIREFDGVTATNGFETLERAQGYNLDLAIVDLKTPGMDGEECCARNRASDDQNRECGFGPIRR